MISTEYYLKKRKENGGTFEGLDRRFDLLYANRTYFVRNIHTLTGYAVHSTERMNELLQGGYISNDEVVQISCV